MDRKWHERIVRYVPLFLWVGFIFLMSSSTGSMSETSRFIRPLLEFLFPGATEETLRLYHGYIRKFAHVAEYAILAVFACRAFRAQPDRRGLSAVFAICLVIVVAILDESNQSFNSARTGSANDVVIDLAGGLFGILLFMAASSRIRPRA